MEGDDRSEHENDNLLAELFRSPVIRPLGYVVGPAGVAAMSEFLAKGHFTDVFLVCTAIEGTMMLVKWIGRNKE